MNEGKQTIACSVCNKNAGCAEMEATGRCNWNRQKLKDEIPTTPLSVTSERQYCNCEHGVCAGMPTPAGAQCLSAIRSEDFKLQPAAPKPQEILFKMAETFKERNAVYGDNYKMVSKLMAVLFPNGVPPELVVQEHFHIFELILVKLSRYAISELSHIDSIHDLAVYGAMCESINHERNLPK